MLQIFRAYNSADGETHFEDLTLDQFDEIVKKGTGPIDLNRHSPPFSPQNDYHNAPRRLFLVILSGKREFEVSDGTVKHLSPGDVVVWEDVTGGGHRNLFSGSIGDEIRVSLSISLSD